MEFMFKIHCVFKRYHATLEGTLFRKVFTVKFSNIHNICLHNIHTSCIHLQGLMWKKWNELPARAYRKQYREWSLLLFSKKESWFYSEKCSVPEQWLKPESTHILWKNIFHCVFRRIKEEIFILKIRNICLSQMP